MILHRKVRGHCPACAHETLALTRTGTLVCCNLDCPRPDATAQLLALPGQQPAEPQCEHGITLGDLCRYASAIANQEPGVLLTPEDARTAANGLRWASQHHPDGAPHDWGTTFHDLAERLYRTTERQEQHP